MRRTYLGVGLVTLATLLLELLLTRIFSVTLYYHFAFMVISLALFGIGLSGVVLYLRPERYPEERLRELLARQASYFAVATVISLTYVVNQSVSSHLDATGAGHFNAQSFFQLAFLYLFAALPFYFGGMTVSLALFHLRRQVATLYFFDLVGASLACLLLDPLLRGLGGPSAILVVALLASLAALLFSSSRRRLWLLVGAASLLALNLVRPFIEVGSVKEVNQEFLAFSRWNALSRIEVQELPGLPPQLTIDAMARTGICSLQRSGPAELEGIAALVHSVRQRGHMLIIGPGGGIDVVAALRSGQHRVVDLAEINPIILHDVMLGRYRSFSDGLYAQPQVRPHVAEGRSFVRRSRERYDVIQATLVDTWAATAAGAFSLSENHLYTVEAFEDYLQHLERDGVLTMSRWVSAPGMEFVRLAAVARAGLLRLGVTDPRRFTFAAAFGRLGTLLVKRTPFTDAELDRLHRTCDERKFTVLASPRGKWKNPVQIVLGAEDPASFYREFPLDVRPVDDNRPFFFYAVKPERLWKELFSKGAMPLNSFSAVVLVALLGIVGALVLCGIVLPLWLSRRALLRGQLGSKLRDLGFFIGIGVGYILVEIALLHRFTLHLGHPTHALRVVLFSLLLFSGLGSLLSGRARSGPAVRAVLVAAALTVIAVCTVYALLLPRWLAPAVGWSFGGRLALCLGLVAVPALAMGMLLPSGLRLLGGRHAEIVPWAWGLNGAASVLGSVLAMFISLHHGFAATLLGGAFAYALALLFALRRPPATT
jgi:hypothetical protein